MSTSVTQDFEELVKQRMERFLILLQHAQFDFKQYQSDGVEWCIRNELRPEPLSNIRGGIIADEMGLGKTITMIGTMFCNFLKKTLIIVPPVLIKQWANELFRTTGHRVIIFKNKNKDVALLNAPIVITSYNMLLQKDCLLKKMAWNRIIFDEAHHLRNSKTKIFRSCLQLRARVRWLVTGTPIQNQKKDFTNLCSAFGLKNIEIAKAFILRRTKSDVGINLPALTTNHCVIDWTNETEMRLSEEIHALLPSQTGVSAENRKQLAELFGRGGALIAILRAKQSCILPNLMRKSVEMFTHEKLLTNDYLDTINYSSKLDAVIKCMVSRKANGKGKIVFCHYREEIDMIANRLKMEGFEKVVCYDGRNSGGKNLLLIAEPADALIIQIQTGCEGLNLQHNFSEIYFISPHWNPRIEDQAIARCHRIGQKEEVSVFKFEMNGFPKSKESDSKKNPITLEKYINKVQTIKRIISDEILNPLPNKETI